MFVSPEGRLALQSSGSFADFKEILMPIKSARPKASTISDIAAGVSAAAAKSARKAADLYLSVGVANDGKIDLVGDFSQFIPACSEVARHVYSPLGKVEEVYGHNSCPDDSGHFHHDPTDIWSYDADFRRIPEKWMTAFKSRPGICDFEKSSSVSPKPTSEACKVNQQRVKALRSWNKDLSVACRRKNLLLDCTASRLARTMGLIQVPRRIGVVKGGTREGADSRADTGRSLWRQELCRHFFAEASVSTQAYMNKVDTGLLRAAIMKHSTLRISDLKASLLREREIEVIIRRQPQAENVLTQLARQSFARGLSRVASWILGPEVTVLSKTLAKKYEREALGKY